MKPTILIVNSKDRISGTSTNFNYQIKYYGKEEIQSYRIGKVTIPYSYYNIKRQFFTFRYNNVLYDIEVPAGNYTAQSLATFLQNELSTQTSAAVTVTYSQLTNRFSVVVSSPNVFSFDFEDPIEYNYSVQKALGFANIIPNTSTYTSVNSANLNCSDNLYIRSRTLSYYTPSIFQTQRDQVIQLVPILVNPFNFIFYENQQEINFPSDYRSLSTFDIQLIDDYGNIIDLNGLDWTFEIQIYNPIGDK